MLTKLRKASSADIAQIASLAEKIWREHYTPIIGAAQVDYMLKKMYSAESLLEQQKEGQQFFLAELDGKVIGYISVSAPDRHRDGNDYFLHKFYLDAAEQGKGLGKLFFAELITNFPGMKTMRLQANRMNFKTINFYFRLGFVIEEAKDFDIGEGFFMEDYVMILRK
jgi:diamine N-acetyltransferase